VKVATLPAPGIPWLKEPRVDPGAISEIQHLGRQTPTQPVRVLCQDESRLGLHLPTRRHVTGYGVKPIQIVESL
jgi:hypothetical protein